MLARSSVEWGTRAWEVGKSSPAVMVVMDTWNAMSILLERGEEGAVKANNLWEWYLTGPEYDTISLGRRV